MSWIWKEENWPNWGLFVVTNTGKDFRRENMRNVNKVSRNRERVFGNTTSDYMSHCPLAWVSSRAGITEGRPMALVTSTGAPRPPAETDLLWKPYPPTDEERTYSHPGYNVRLGYRQGVRPLSSLPCDPGKSSK